MIDIESSSAQEAVEQILADPRRSFKFEDPKTGNIDTYFIGEPTGADIRKADWQYSKVFNQALIDGFPTQAQMVEELTKRGIIGEHFNSEVEEARISLAAALFRLETLPEQADAEKEGTAIEVAQLRDRLFKLNQKVNGPMGNTCENLAEDARTEYLTARLIENKKGQKIWKDFDAYLNEDNTALTIKARFEIMLWLQGLDSNFLDNTPEQKTLRSLAEKRLATAMTRKEHKEAVDSLPETSPPKAKRKPKAAKKETPFSVERSELKQAASNKARRTKKSAPASEVEEVVLDNKLFNSDAVEKPSREEE